MITDFDPPARSRPRGYSRPCKNYVPDYVGYYKPDGSIGVKRMGNRDLYAEIQAYADSCNLQLLIQRYLAGDETALSRRQGVYADITQVPTTLAEIADIVAQAHSEFDALPLEVRQQYGNDFNRYATDIHLNDVLAPVGTDAPIGAAAPAADPVPADNGGDNGEP